MLPASTSSSLVRGERRTSNSRVHFRKGDGNLFRNERVRSPGGQGIRELCEVWLPRLLQQQEALERGSAKASEIAERLKASEAEARSALLDAAADVMAPLGGLTAEQQGLLPPAVLRPPRLDLSLLGEPRGRRVAGRLRGRSNAARQASAGARARAIVADKQLPAAGSAPDEELAELLCCAEAATQQLRGADAVLEAASGRMSELLREADELADEADQTCSSLLAFADAPAEPWDGDVDSAARDTHLFDTPDWPHVRNCQELAWLQSASGQELASRLYVLKAQQQEQWRQEWLALPGRLQADPEDYPHTHCAEELAWLHGQEQLALQACAQQLAQQRQRWEEEQQAAAQQWGAACRGAAAAQPGDASGGGAVPEPRSGQEAPLVPPTIKVDVGVQLQTKPGQDVVLVGSHPTLGSWDLNNALPLAWSDGHVWRASLELPHDCDALEYKAVVRLQGSVLFESGCNHKASLKGSGGGLSLFHVFSA